MFSSQATFMQQFPFFKNLSNCYKNSKNNINQTIDDPFKISRREHEMLYFIRSNNIDFEAMRLFIHTTYLRRNHETCKIECDDISDDEEQIARTRSNKKDINKPQESVYRTPTNNISDNIKTALIKTFLKSASDIITDTSKEINKNSETTVLSDSDERDSVEIIAAVNDETTFRYQSGINNCDVTSTPKNIGNKRYHRSKKRRPQVMQYVPYNRYQQQRLLFNPLLPFLINQSSKSGTEILTNNSEIARPVMPQSKSCQTNNTLWSLSNSPHHNMKKDASTEVLTSGNLSTTNCSPMAGTDGIILSTQQMPLIRESLSQLNIQEKKPYPTSSHQLDKPHDYYEKPFVNKHTTTSSKLQALTYKTQPSLQNNISPELDLVANMNLTITQKMRSSSNTYFPSSRQLQTPSGNNNNNFGYDSNERIEHQQLRPQERIDDYIHPGPVLAPPIDTTDAYQTSSQQLQPPIINYMDLSARHTNLPPIQDIYRSPALASVTYPVNQDLRPVVEQYVGPAINNLSGSSSNSQTTSLSLKNVENFKNSNRVQIVSIEQLQPPNIPPNDNQKLTFHQMIIKHPGVQNRHLDREENSLNNKMHSKPNPNPMTQWPDMPHLQNQNTSSMQPQSYHKNQTQLQPPIISSNDNQKDDYHQMIIKYPEVRNRHLDREENSTDLPSQTFTCRPTNTNKLSSLNNKTHSKPNPNPMTQWPDMPHVQNQNTSSMQPQSYHKNQTQLQPPIISSNDNQKDDYHQMIIKYPEVRNRHLDREENSADLPSQTFTCRPTNTNKLSSSDNKTHSTPNRNPMTQWPTMPHPQNQNTWSMQPYHDTQTRVTVKDFNQNYLEQNTWSSYNQNVQQITSNNVRSAPYQRKQKKAKGRSKRTLRTKPDASSSARHPLNTTWYQSSFATPQATMLHSIPNSQETWINPGTDRFRGPVENMQPALQPGYNYIPYPAQPQWQHQPRMPHPNFNQPRRY